MLAPVLNPDLQHHLPFNALNGKRCMRQRRIAHPLNYTNKPNTKTNQFLNILLAKSSQQYHVISVINQVLLLSSTALKCQLGDENLKTQLLTCGMHSSSTSLYASGFLKCLSQVNNSFYLSVSRNDYVSPLWCKGS